MQHPADMILSVSKSYAVSRCLHVLAEIASQTRPTMIHVRRQQIRTHARVPTLEASVI